MYSLVGREGFALHVGVAKVDATSVGAEGRARHRGRVKQEVGLGSAKAMSLRE